MNPTESSNRGKQGTQAVALGARSANASMWRDTVVVPLGLGLQEAFSIGPDGFLWSYRIDAPANRAGRLMGTGLATTRFTVGQSGDGRRVVVAAEGARLRYVIETGSENPRWSTPSELHFPGVQDAISAEQILAQSINGNLFLGVLMRHCAPKGEDCYRFWDAVWAGGGFVFCHKPALLDHGHSIWMDELSSRPMPF